MAWLISLVVLAVLAAAAIWFFARFYRKATREIALVRTGYGGKRVVLDGGCLSLPFLNQVAEVNMKTARLEIRRDGQRAPITQDRLRVDIAVEFYLRVQPNEQGVATAAQALGGKTFRVAELQEILEGKLIGAIQSVVARHSMDELHEQRAEFVEQVRLALADSLARNGLELESVSLTQLDQTAFQALDENNAFNAEGMRRLAEVIATNKKQRAAIESDAEVAVRQSQLEAIKRKLILEREETEAEIDQQLTLEMLRSKQVAEIAEHNANADQRSEAARLDKDRRVRELKLNTELTLQLAERQNEVDLARKAAEVAAAQVETDAIRAQAAAAAEQVQAERDKAIAERARQVALIRVREQAEVNSQRSQSAAESIRTQAQADADASTQRARAKTAELEAEAGGQRALAEADNTLSDSAVRLRLEQRKLDTLPALVAQMVKPVEKIEGIRINHIGGLGTAPGAVGSDDKPLVNQAIDGLMGMAVQLPVLEKLGRELGINLEQGISRVTEAPPDQARSPSADDASGEDNQSGNVP